MIECIDHVTEEMPAQCPACDSTPNPNYKHHEPTHRFFGCGCSYIRMQDGRFGHYHPCNRAFVAAVELRKQIADREDDDYYAAIERSLNEE